MKRFESGKDFAKDMGIKPEVLQKTCQFTLLHCSVAVPPVLTPCFLPLL